MAESKFAGIFKQTPAPEPEPQQPPSGRTEKAPAAPPSARRPLGRPPGKRSDPAWKQYSVLLKRETQREAANLLRQKDEGLDLSGLVQNLLEAWIKKQQA